MELKKIEIGDNDYAVVLSEMTHVTHKLVSKIWEDAAGGYDKWVALSLKVNAAPDFPSKAAVLKDIRLGGIDLEVTFLHQAKELWIDGKSQPITQETLDNMADKKCELLLSEVEKLYTQVPLAVKS